MREILVMDIMTRDPVSVSPNSNLLDCAKQMVKKRVGSLLIVDKKKLVGFLSYQDILWALVKKSQKDLSEIIARDISPRKVVTINPNSSIRDTINKMKKFGYERLPVVQNGEFVGIITSRDILSFNPEFYPELEEIEGIKEEQEKINRIKGIDPSFIEGVCEECGSREYLLYFNGVLICESCKESMQ